MILLRSRRARLLTPFLRVRPPLNRPNGDIPASRRLHTQQRTKLRQILIGESHHSHLCLKILHHRTTSPLSGSIGLSLLRECYRNRLRPTLHWRPLITPRVQCPGLKLTQHSLHLVNHTSTSSCVRKSSR